MCGNHIAWDVEEVQETRLRHTRSSRESALQLLARRVHAYADRSAQQDERRIAAAKKYALGQDEEETIRRIMTLDLPGITRTYAQEAWALAVAHQDTDGPPTTAWGLAQGFTRVAQHIPYANVRSVLDRSAGRPTTGR